MLKHQVRDYLLKDKSTLKGCREDNKNTNRRQDYFERFVAQNYCKESKAGRWSRRGLPSKKLDFIEKLIWMSKVNVT